MSIISKLADLQTVDSILGLNGETPSKYSDNIPN